MNRIPQVVLIQTNTTLLLRRGTEKQIETNQCTVKRNTEKTITEWVVHLIEEILSFPSCLSCTYTHTHIYILDLFEKQCLLNIDFCKVERQLNRAA